MQPIWGGSNPCGVHSCCSFTVIFSQHQWFHRNLWGITSPRFVCVHAPRSHKHPTRDRTLSSKLPFWGTPRVTVVWNDGILSTEQPAHSTAEAQPRCSHPPWLFSRCTAWTGPPSVRSCPPPCTAGQSPLCPSLCSSETDYPGGGLPAAQRSPFWSVTHTETERQHLRKTL